MRHKSVLIKDIIDEIAMGPFGSNIKVDSFVKSGIPVLNGRNLTGFKLKEEEFNYVTEEKAASLKKAVASRGDVVVTHRGTLGQISYIPYDSKFPQYVISQSQFRVRCNCEKVLPEFLVYYFHTRTGQHQLLSNSSQVGVPALARPSSTFQSIEISIPPISEQKQIISILGQLNSKIENNTAINHHLEQIAQAIFKSWFVDFEPWGGEMPDDWMVGALADIAKITMGQSPEGESYNEDGKGVVFYQGRTDFGQRFPTRRLFTTQPKRMAEKGDILISVRAPVGDLNVAIEPCCVGRGLAAIQSKNGYQSFILYTMYSLHEKMNVFNGEGTVFGSINKTDMANLPVTIPSEIEINRYNQIIAPIDALIESNSMENNVLSSLRESLLPRLLSGELSVSDLPDLP